jgi:hypothetical protein
LLKEPPAAGVLFHERLKIIIFAMDQPELGRIKI